MRLKPNRFRQRTYIALHASEVRQLAHVTDEKNIETCLQCDKANCNGDCERIRAKRFKK